MSEIYGHRWVSSYGKTPNESWTKVLTELNAENIKSGIDRMLSESLKWPPTLTEFVSFCKPAKPEPRKAAHKTWSLPKPVRKPEDRTLHTNGLRDVMRNPTLSDEDRLELQNQERKASRLEINQQIRAEAMQ